MKSVLGRTWDDSFSHLVGNRNARSPRGSVSGKRDTTP